MPQDNPVGLCRLPFLLPAAREGKQVFVNFEGANSAFLLWLTGELVGFSKGSHMLAEFNLTRLL